MEDAKKKHMMNELVAIKILTLFKEGHSIDRIASGMKKTLKEVQDIIITHETYKMEPIYEQLKPGECFILRIMENPKEYKILYISHKKPGVLTLEESKIKNTG